MRSNHPSGGVFSSANYCSLLSCVFLRAVAGRSTVGTGVNPGDAGRNRHFEFELGTMML